MEEPQKQAGSQETAVPPPPMAFIGPIRLIPGEEKRAYAELLARVTTSVQPCDIIEEMWTRDVVDLAFETLRLRRLKASLLDGRAHNGLNKVLLALDRKDAFDLLPAWAAREDDAVAEVKETLASAGWSMDTVMAQTLADDLEYVEGIERMSRSIEARRDAALTRIEHRREKFGNRLRDALETIEARGLQIVAPRNAPEAAPT